MSAIEHETSATTSVADDEGLVVSVVIPCLNEAQNIEECVSRARAVLEEHDIRRRGDRRRQ